MADIASLSNEELRNALIEHGANVGPIGPSTRTVYEKKLIKLMAGGADNSMVNDSMTSIPDEPIVRRTASPVKGKKTAAAPAIQEDRGAASSDEERGEESMRYLDEEEEEEYRRSLSPSSNDPIFANDSRVEMQKNGGASTGCLIVSILIFFIFSIFLLMRSLEIETGGENREEL